MELATLTKEHERIIMGCIDTAAALAPALTNKTRHELFVIMRCLLELRMPMIGINIDADGQPRIFIADGQVIYSYTLQFDDTTEPTLRWYLPMKGLRKPYLATPLTRDNVLLWLQHLTFY